MVEGQKFLTRKDTNQDPKFLKLFALIPRIQITKHKKKVVGYQEMLKENMEKVKIVLEMTWENGEHKKVGNQMEEWNEIEEQEHKSH